MKRNIIKKGPRNVRVKQGHQDLRSNPFKYVELDTSQGLPGIFYQVSQVICSQISNDNKSKDLCLAFINNAVGYISKSSHGKVLEEINQVRNKQDEAQTKINSTCNHLKEENSNEDWQELRTKEKYFTLFRCALLNKFKEVRVAGLRFLRYIIKTEDDVACIIKTNTVPLVVRSIDICIDNYNERLHGVRLARHLLHIAPGLFPKSLARCLIAIAKDGMRERDKLLRSAQAVINELAIFNSQVFIDCGGVSSTLYGILDCSMPRVNEALISSLLFLLNDPAYRKACSQFHMIMAPFSDIHYKHHEFDIEYSKSEERELRRQASCFALLAAFRSWPGLITIYQPQDHTMEALIHLLRIPSESTREVVLDFIYDLLSIQIGTSHTDYDKALQERAFIRPPDPDSWRLHEGFVVAESQILLPHIAKFRPNLIQNYFSLILYTLIKKDLLSSLCEVIITASQSMSIKTTILLGEILHLSDQNLPDCGMMSHALPILSEKAACSNGEERLKASQAITALLQLSRTRLRRSSYDSKGVSLYLANILEGNKDNAVVGGVSGRSHSDFGKISRWLSRGDHDEQIQQVLKNSGVFGKGSDSNWNWRLLTPVLRFPSASLVALEETYYRSLIERLLLYFKPSSKMFSRVEATHSSAQIQIETLLVFVDFLLEISNEDQEKFLSDLLNDINLALKEVACEMPFHDTYLSPSHLSITVCQYYFLAIGRLSRSSKGYELINKAGIFQQMLVVIEKSVSDVYAKLFATTLDYTIDGLNRSIYRKILTSTKESSRMYGTQLLRVLVRAQARGFARWGIEMLVGQLYDDSRLVSLAALDVLDEALDNEEYLEAILNNPPSVQHLGDNGQLLLAKLVSSPQGFRTYQDCNFVSTLLDKWANNFNLKYVKFMQMALSESLTHLQRGDDGLYGRRTGSKHVVHDVFVLPHLYGSLTLHKEGFALLVQHESLSNLMETIRESNVSNIQETFKLKSAIWALGHLGRSRNGVNFLNSEDLLSSLVSLGASCPVYSVRGTVFNALCLVASTWEGANILQKHGWESVRRHHHEQQIWPNAGEREIALSPDEPPRKTQQSESDDPEDQEVTKAGFYFMDESEEEEMESFSLLIDDLDGDASTRKSQTLPHDSKPPSYAGHQRSLSDCIPVIEELSGGSPHQSSQESSLSKRGTRLKNRILSSFRKKSSSSSTSKRRDSLGSRTSNSSSASEKMFNFLNPSRRRRKRGKSFASNSREEDFFADGSAQSHSCTDEEVGDDLDVLSRVPKLSPIASGTSLSGVVGMTAEDVRDRKKSKFISTTPLSPPLSHSATGYVGSGGGSGSFYKVRALAAMQRRRRVSESSHEEPLQSKNSLRDFLSSSSYDQHTFARGIARSPSGCSELSSVRSFGALGPRAGGSSNWLTSRGREGTQTPCIDDDPSLHPSGLCYMGLAIPVDVDKLLLDTTSTSPWEGRFIKEETDKNSGDNVLLSDSQFSSKHLKINGQDLRGQNISNAVKSWMNNGDENLALEFHRKEICLRCYTFLGGSRISGGLKEKLTWEERGSGYPPTTAKRIQEILRPEAETNTAGDNKSTEKERSSVTRFAARKDILKFVTNLSTTFIAKTSESGLLALKSRFAWAFQDACLYAEICILLSSYSYRLNARRFVQELFLDLVFKEVFEEAHQILREDESMYQNVNEKLRSILEKASRGSEAVYPDIPEYSVDEFEGFDMDGPS